MGDDEKKTTKIEISIGGEQSGQLAAGENVFQIGPVSGGQVHVSQPGQRASPESAEAEPGLAPDLLQRVRQVLLDCGPMSVENELAAVFVDERLSALRHELPHAASARARGDAVIAWLWPRSVGRTNALVLLLQVLADRYPAEDGCARALRTTATDLAEQLDPNEGSREEEGRDQA